MKTSITIAVDTDSLKTETDSQLASLWHVAQANPADPFQDRAAGQLAEIVGREIIRRFLLNAPPELWKHQGGHFDWGKLHLNKPMYEQQP